MWSLEQVWFLITYETIWENTWTFKMNCLCQLNSCRALGLKVEHISIIHGEPHILCVDMTHCSCWYNWVQIVFIQFNSIIVPQIWEMHNAVLAGRKVSSFQSWLHLSIRHTEPGYGKPTWGSNCRSLQQSPYIVLRGTARAFSWPAQSRQLRFWCGNWPFAISGITVWGLRYFPDTGACHHFRAVPSGDLAVERTNPGTQHSIHFI